MDSDRLISAERLVIKLAKKNRFGRIEYDDIMAVIADAPTVDAVEAVHGRWIEDYETFVQDNGYESEPIHTGFLCSVCGRHSCSIEPYCHCGAKMDGGN